VASLWKDRFTARVKQSVPTVKNVHLPSSGCSRFHAYIQIKKTAGGAGREAIVAALGVDRRVKHVVVVDEDINIFDDAEVLWAVATRSRWDRDLVVIPNMICTTRDPTAYAGSPGDLSYHAYTVAKGGIDATMPAPPETLRNQNQGADDVMRKVQLESSSLRIFCQGFHRMRERGVHGQFDEVVVPGMR